MSPPEKASAIEARYHKLKEKHSELIGTHAELLRKVGGGVGGAGHGQDCLRPPAVPEQASVPCPCRTQTRPSS